MKHLRFSLFSILLVLVFSLQAKTIRYVKVDGTGDGSSWSNASNSIQNMIDISTSGDEVWVAKGTYYPMTETIARDPRSRTFVLKNGVSIFGGFSGTESAISQREIADLDLNGYIDSCELVNTTLLSGDIDGVDDVWIKTLNTDEKIYKWMITGNSGNCYHVVTGGFFNNYTSLNGFSIKGGNANVTNNDSGGGIYNCPIVKYCNISNCSASTGGGIYSCSESNSGNKYASVVSCNLTDCFATVNGGGIYSYSYSAATGFSTSKSPTSYVINCKITSCSTTGNGGGIYSYAYCSSSSYSAISHIENCYISNCSTTGNGGGVYSSCNFDSSLSSSKSYSNILNCTISNCSANLNGGGAYYYYRRDSPSDNVSAKVQNCVVNNCFAAVSGGGIYCPFVPTFFSNIINCATSNNICGILISNVFGGRESGAIEPNLNIAYVKPTSFVGITTTKAQTMELLTADWHLKEGSPCINSGNTNKINYSVTDKDGNLRTLYGGIDIGAYEYTISTKSIPISENFNNLSDWNNSSLIYYSTIINGFKSIKWKQANQKVVFSWETNLTTSYTEPFFSYQIDATKISKVFLQYDMFFQAYAGTISPLGTEKLNVEFSTNLVNWSAIATYSNANGTIANQTYKHDISALAAGKMFFIRFNANGANSNRIEKWEIDNVIIDTDDLSAVKTLKADKYFYKLNNGNIVISNLGQAASVHLFDVNGKMLESKIESQTVNFTLPVHGVYVVKVASDSGIENKKIVW